MDQNIYTQKHSSNTSAIFISRGFHNSIIQRCVVPVDEVLIDEVIVLL